MLPITMVWMNCDELVPVSCNAASMWIQFVPYWPRLNVIFNISVLNL